MKRTVVYIGAAAILFFVWWILSSFLALPIVPNPWSVVSCLQSIFLSSIAIHAIYSLGRIALGLVLAVGIGYPIGIFMGYAARADRIFSPFVYLMYPVPKIALLPILMLLAGVGEISKVLMLFLIIVFQVIIAVRDAVRAIPQETYMPLLSLGASFFFHFSPCSLAGVFAQIHYSCARCHGDGDFRIVFYGDIRFAIWVGIFHHGRMASCQLFGDVCRNRCAQSARTAALLHA